MEYRCVDRQFIVQGELPIDESTHLYESLGLGYAGSFLFVMIKAQSAAFAWNSVSSPRVSSYTGRESETVQKVLLFLSRT